MPTVDVNGTTLFFEDTGPGSTGETIVEDSNLSELQPLGSPSD